MADQHRICAQMHKENDPAETRTLDELEAYYRSLSMSSPFAPLVQAWQEQDAAEGAAFEASLAVSQARRP